MAPTVQHILYHVAGWGDNGSKDRKLGLSPDLLLVPEDATEATKCLRGLAYPGVDLQIRTTVILYNASQVLETGDRLNRGLVGRKMDGCRLWIEGGWKGYHGLGLRTAYG